MHQTSIGRHLGLFLTAAVALPLSGSGCAYHSEYMTEGNPPQQWRPPPGQALVVFLRPSGTASSLGVTIIDDRGHFLGDATAKARFAVPMSAERHIFMTWSENTDVLVADLAPNKTYYIEVGAEAGAVSPRFYLYALKPGSKNYPKRERWMSSTRPLFPNSAPGQAYLDAHTADVAERIKQGLAHLTEYEHAPKELDAHMLRPEDGG